MKLELIAVIVGVTLHQTEKIVARLDTDSVTIKRLFRYAIGILGTKPIYEAMRKNEKTQDQAYILSFVFVGLGVLLGYIADSFHDAK